MGCFRQRGPVSEDPAARDDGMSFLPSGLWAQPLEADSSPSPCKVQLRVGAGRVPLGCFHPRRKGGKEGNPPSGAASVTPEQDRPSFPCPCVSSLARSLGASGLPRSCAPPSVLSVTSGTVLRSQPDRVLSPRPALREPHEWVFLHTHFPGSLGGSALSLAVPPPSRAQSPHQERWRMSDPCRPPPACPAVSCL